MWKIVIRAFLLLLAVTVLTGVLYPLAVTGLAQLFFPSQANGSLIRNQGKVIGSVLIGQDFRSPRYFHGRPSAANYDATASGGSNLGPTNRVLLKTIADRVKAVRQENQLSVDHPVPSDLVTASASGLDPHISPDGALLQIPRVAKSRRLSVATVRQLVQKYTEHPVLGILGSSRVNVLRINLALDSLKNGG
ncbi:MAG TPA: potassium-transporting ATPase subunit C [Firmicutes bacterium]|jgi:potassium-transporting ATPase KdpC subunit|nr:potassium-transporting ATPase subunit C [Bacillota bacterium]